MLEKANSFAGGRGDGSDQLTIVTGEGGSTQLESYQLKKEETVFAWTGRGLRIGHW